LPTTSELALDCRDLTKSYRLGQILSLRRTVDLLVPWRRPQALDILRALDSVSFQVPRGDFFGIVGTNGSGKSTLTQIISDITVPTSGEITVWGRVLPLLEVGAGFHEELTGRENVALLGSVLGIPAHDVRHAVPRILDFSSVERHFDTPLKRYSTGMRARLSFATAICFPAEVYVFDEVLAVVDDEFRDRCVTELQKLNDAGRTIIFMSHDLSLVTGICRTGMWLEKGNVRAIGAMQEVAYAYGTSAEHARAVMAETQAS
jgi:ABC-type polysaccharide/polyol phosphate transport system ATPase subunit